MPLQALDQSLSGAGRAAGICVVDEVVLPQERLLPQNMDAEQAVLGSLLIDPVAITRIATFLRPLDFYLPQHVDIFTAILDLFQHENQPSDLVTLSDSLNRRGQLAAVGGLAYLNQLANAVPTSINIEHYAHIVERLAVMRRLVDAGSRIAGVGYDEANGHEQAIEKSEEILFEVSRSRLGRDFRSITNILDEYYQRLDYIHEHKGLVTGVTTGFVDLDKITGGLQDSDLVILAARPAMGKSSLALNIAYAAAKNEKRVGIFTLEMSAEQLIQRLLSMEAQIDSQRLRTGYIADDEWDRLTEGVGALSQMPIYIEDSANISIAEMRSKSRRLHMEKGLDLIIVDYLQLMQGGSQENRVQEISEISRALKGLARDLDIPVLALSQLSRAPDQRPNHVPMLSDLRESGSIEQDADVVIFIYRDKVYNKETEHPHVADVIVAKHRNGPTDQVHLFFKENQTRFLDLAVYAEDDDTGFRAEDF